jgi:cytochrome c553
MRMLTNILLLASAAVTIVGVSAARTEERPIASPPAWAFPVNPPRLAAPKDDGKMHTLPGSTKSFAFKELRDRFAPPDWYPDDHPAMPPLAAHGAQPGAGACGFCHLPTGFGRPENANLAGLPADYIIKQVQDFKSGARKTSLPNRIPPKLMMELAVQAATEPGLAEAAKYFESMKPKPMTKVVETDTAPKTEVNGRILKKADEGGTEPIGERIVEVPDDFERFEERDGRLMFTAYVPPGSLKKGEELVATGGNGKTIACGVCHGADLKGVAFVPPIAGRSPSYLARQMYDIQSGARHGDGAALMKAVVAKLTNADLVAIAAYVASQAP